jgi:predicted MPP superfamily phosphohydrolase
MILLKPYWKNIIAQAILHYAQNNFITGSISLDELIGFKFDVIFDELYDVEKDNIQKNYEELKDICGDVKLTEKEQFEALSYDKKLLILKAVISKFFEDGVCYFRHNSLVFPGRFVKKGEFLKDKFFEVDRLRLVSRRNAEFTIGVAISYLYYYDKYIFEKHLDKGVVIRDKDGVRYLIEIFGESDDEKRNQAYSEIKVYADTPENNGKELIAFLLEVVKEKLEFVYDRIEISGLADDRKKFNLILEYDTMYSDLKNKVVECLKNNNKKLHKLVVKNEYEFDSRIITEIEDKFEKDKDRILKKIDSIIEKIQNENDLDSVLYKEKKVFLHLSDIHFDKNTDIENQFCLFQKDLQKQNYNPDNYEFYLVISGDLSVKAERDEFEKACNFIEKVMNEYEITPKRVLIVPGNHDYSMKVTQSAYEVERFDKNKFDPEKDYKINDKLMLVRNETKWKRKFENFSNFVYERIYNRAYEWNERTVEIETDEFYFLLINTSKDIDQFFPDRIIHDPRDLIKCSNDKIKIAIAHHPLDWSYDRYKASLFYQNLNEFGFRFLMHGHIHTEKLIVSRDYLISKSPLFTIGAGIFYAYKNSAMLPGVPMRYNILELTVDKESKEIKEATLKARERENNQTGWSASMIFYDEHYQKKDKIKII